MTEDEDPVDIPRVILGINGPIKHESLNHTIMLYESFFFDKKFPNFSSSARLTIENRHEAVMNPSSIRDNLVGGLDMFEFELKSSTLSRPSLICMHSNDILLNGSRESVERFRTICKQYSVNVMLAIGIPDDVAKDPIGLREKGIETLVSHIHYGSSHGLLFGMLGPVESEIELEIFLSPSPYWWSSYVD